MIIAGCIIEEFAVIFCYNLRLYYSGVYGNFLMFIGFVMAWSAGVQRSDWSGSLRYPATRGKRRIKQTLVQNPWQNEKQVILTVREYCVY